MAEQTKPIAKFSPGFRSIKLYADGQIEYQGKTGSVVGATARVDASGSKRIFRDTREVFLIIEGPSVSIAAALANKNHLVRTAAQKFAASVNRVAMQLAPSSGPSGPSASGSVIDDLERLGKLRDSGVLTEEEFQAQKSALLADARES